MEDSYKHIVEEDGHSVAYAQVGLCSGLNVSSCLNIARHAKLSDRRIRFTKSHDNAKRREHRFVANAENPYSLLSLGVQKGDILRIEVDGDDHIAKGLADRFHSVLTYKGISVHL